MNLTCLFIVIHFLLFFIWCALLNYYPQAIAIKTRMHSSRMRTGRSLTVCCGLLPGGGGAWSGGSAPGGVCLVRGEGVSAPGGCLVQGVSALGGGVPGLGGCLLLGGLPGLGGVCLPGGCAWSRGVVCLVRGGWCVCSGGWGVCSQGVCLVQGGVCSWGGWCAWSGGVGCLLPGGVVCLVWRGLPPGGCLLLGIPACTEADTPPPPWTDRCL